MGLDMYAYTMRAEFVGDRQTDVMPTTDEEREQAELTEIAYWRKFNHLHGWMENLYREKGGQENIFNCRTVRLELEDLERLEQALLWRGRNLFRRHSDNKRIYRDRPRCHTERLNRVL